MRINKKRLLKKVMLVVISTVFSMLLVEIALQVSGKIYYSLQVSRSKQISNGYVILALGESTTAGVKNSWPRKLEEILNQRHPEKKFSVVNKGASGTNTGFILAELEENLDRYKPDMVVSMMGINDELAGIPFVYNPTNHNTVNLFIYRLKLVRLMQGVVALFRHFSTQNLTNLSQRNMALRSYQGEDDELYQDQWYDKNSNSTEYLQLITSGWNFLQDNRTTEAVSQFLQAINIQPNNPHGYYSLASAHDKAGEYSDAITSIETAIQYSKSGTVMQHWILVKKGEIYLHQNKGELAAQVLGATIEKYPKSVYAITMYENAKKMESGRNQFRTNKFSPNNLETSQMTQEEITSYHYNMLSEILAKRGIIHFAMQYPTLPVMRLKNTLFQKKNVKYISNENFKDVLGVHKYNDIFIDKFGTTFGHTTDFGSRLIAENVANSIEEYIKDNK